MGKTETVRALAETIFGNKRAFTRVNCQEYSAHYNISKLLGSPPGYVGGEIRPLLAQENIDRHHRKALENQSGMISEADSKLSRLYPPDSEKNLSIILFDEIEKAHPKLWNLLLGILEDGTVVLGNNEEVDFRQSIIILTTNVGSDAMGAHLAQTASVSPPASPTSQDGPGHRGSGHARGQEGLPLRVPQPLRRHHHLPHAQGTAPVQHPGHPDRPGAPPLAAVRRALPAGDHPGGQALPGGARAPTSSTAPGR